MFINQADSQLTRGVIDETSSSVILEATHGLEENIYLLVLEVHELIA